MIGFLKRFTLLFVWLYIIPVAFLGVLFFFVVWMPIYPLLYLFYNKCGEDHLDQGLWFMEHIFNVLDRVDQWTGDDSC